MLQMDQKLMNRRKNSDKGNTFMKQMMLEMAGPIVSNEDKMASLICVS